jgi:hypothetical protein
MPYEKPSPSAGPAVHAAHASLLVLAAFFGAIALVLRPQAGPSPEDELRAALAEAERLDPGWRPEEIEARRPHLPDAVNSAVCVQEVCERLPPDWPDARLLRLKERPPHLLHEEEIDLLRSELARAASAREEALRLAHLERGHFPLALKDDPFPSMNPFMCARKCGGLLEWQAWLQAHEDDPDSALRSLRCLIRAGAAIDNEPHALAQLIRMAIQNRACETLAVVLAQTQPSDASLQRAEEELRREQAHPLLLWMMRGERIGQHLMFTRASQGRLSWSILMGRPETHPPASPQEAAARDAYRRRLVRATHPGILGFSSRAVEIARLPIPAQQPLLQELKETIRWLPHEQQKLYWDPTLLSRGWLANRALFSCSLAAVAVERYRLRHRRWPDGIADLGPDLLPAIPRDPIDGRPLRYRRLDDGVVIYSVGFDGRDDGGTLAPAPAAGSEGTDVGFRLWDPRYRRQRPLAAAPPGDVFGSATAKDGQPCFLPPLRERSS